MSKVEFPYAKFRPGQKESISTLAKIISSGEAIAFSAPTGFGKTVTVLYACKIINTDKILYAVRTRNEIYPPLRESLKLNYKPVFFTSKKVLCPLLLEKNIPLEDFWENCRILRKEGKCKYYRNVSSIDEALVWKAIRSSEGVPVRIIKKMWSLKLCPYYTFKKVLDSSNLIIVTYPYLFSPFIREYTLESIDLNSLILVVDEAHSLIGLADMMEKRVSKRKVALALKEIEEYGPHEVELKRRLEELLKHWDKLPLGKGYKHVDKRIFQDILGESYEWFDLSWDIRAKKLKRIVDTHDKVKVIVHSLSIATLLSLLEEEAFQAYTMMKGEDKIVVVKTIDPSIIASPVLTNTKCLILMSGTLPSPTFFNDVLGVMRDIKELDVEEIYGPTFPYENRATIVLTYVTSKYTKRSPHIYKSYAKIVEDAYKILPDAILVIYPSYEFMHNVLSRINITAKAIVETEDTRIGDVIDYVLAHKHVLIHGVAGGKLSEGIEVIDEKTEESMIKAVIVAGIPYPQPDDYTNQLLNVIGSRVGMDKAWDHLFRDIASVRTKQALGRAIRSEVDRALYVLCDNRFMDPKVRSKLKIYYNKILTDHKQYVETLKLTSEYLA